MSKVAAVLIVLFAIISGGLIILGTRPSNGGQSSDSILGDAMDKVTEAVTGVFAPRGFRNNNPLNIDYNKANNWQGQTGIETGVSNPRFATFSSMEYGVRAGAKLVQNYMRMYGLTSVNAIINRWAPSVENNTYSYVEHVAHKLGVDPYEPIQETDIPALLYHMIKHENGKYLHMDIVTEGARLAGITA